MGRGVMRPCGSMRDDRRSRRAVPSTCCAMLNTKGLDPLDYDAEWLDGQWRALSAGHGSSDQQARFDVALSLGLLATSPISTSARSTPRILRLDSTSTPRNMIWRRSSRAPFARIASRRWSQRRNPVTRKTTC